MSREMEDRLRAAFDAKASRVTQASVSDGEPPRDGDEPSDGAVVDIGHRRRWIAPMLAAAAVIAIAIGTTAVVTAVRADRDHNSPAHTPTPTPSLSSTSQAPSHSTSPSSSPPASPSDTASGTPSTHTVQTKKVTVQGVTLDVPTDWGAVAANGIGNDCLTVGGRTPSPTNRCQLQVRVVSATQTGGFNPDKPYVVGDGNMCGSGSNAPKVTTTQATNTTVGGQAAEYRAYTGECFTGTWEQWVVPTAPGVIIVRTLADPATEQAARFAVTHAQLPGPRSSLRITDQGYIRSVDSQPDGVHIELDRVTRLEQGGVSDTNPATYSYVLPVNIPIFADTTDLKPLTVQQLVQLAAGKTIDGVAPPLGKQFALLKTDGSQVTSVLLEVL